MAGLKGSVNSGDVACVAATTKTILQILAPANQRLLVDTISVCFDGISPTNEPVTVQIARQSTAGTSSGSANIRKLDSTDDETLQASATYGMTVEPTTGDVLFQLTVHPQGGLIMQLPENRRIVVPGGTRLGILITAPNNVNANAHIWYEE